MKHSKTLVDIIMYAHIFAGLLALQTCESWSPAPASTSRSTRMMAGDDFFGRAARIAKDKVGGIDIDPRIGGALLGGLVAGPFGLILGVNMASSAAERRQQEKLLAEKGITKEVLAEATALAENLIQAKEALSMTEKVVSSTKKRYLGLGEDEERLYAKAKACMSNQDEDGARGALTMRESVKAQQEKAMDIYREATANYDRTASNVKLLEERAAEMENYMNRLMQDGDITTSPYLEAAAPEDPLLARFAALEEKDKKGGV